MPSPLRDIYDRLYARYGPQHWWPAETPFEVVMGAILTQAASWRNVEKGLRNLKDAGALSPEGLRDLPAERLAELIRPCLYYNVKARKLKAFITHLWERHGGSLERLFAQPLPSLREELLSIYGIGDETADDIVLYAAGKPSFVIDSYTRRVLERLGLADGKASYRELQALFHRELPAEAPLFNEYHALLDRHAKEACRVAPVCQGCCLLDLCKGSPFITGPRRLNRVC
ncbi:MAG: endonuclease III domain-containing protein [Chloroflexota bacterium]|nr:endonuclease III domain-containing protein [Chloroflexota bacterium]